MSEPFAKCHDKLKRAAMLGTAGVALIAGSVLGGAPALAQAQAAERAIAFNIPAGPVSESLKAYANATGLQLIYNAKLDTAGSSSGVSGTMSPSDALFRLLQGTGLAFRFVNPTTVTIEGADASSERVLGAVRVEGVQTDPYFGGAGQAAGVNGINGSRDITATEGTKSFTSGALTIGSKVPQAMKDVPQSLSVLTNERLEQQNVTDFTTAMRELPGVTLVQGQSSLENTFYSRGFAINSIQVDGGAPLISGTNSLGSIYFPQIDMSIYDHVELLRGAAGQFGSYGDPGGTVNLVRKKPLDRSQYILEAQAGSWSNHRIVADATSPLALNGKLRGRLVLTYQDNHYFYDIAKDNKTLIYGITELDVTPSTLVTIGISHTRQDSVPWYNGLPRYWTGADLKLPRSTSIVFPWNSWNFDTTEIFGGLEQKIGEDWTAKINLTHNHQLSTQKVGYNNSAVSPLDKTGPYLSGSYTDYASRQLSADATLSGAFTVFGQRQEVTLGVNRVDSDGGGQTSYGSLISTYLTPYQPYQGGPSYCQDYGSGACPPGSIVANGPPIDLFAFDPFDAIYTEPRTPLANYYYPERGQVELGAYINLRLTAFNRLHLTTGLRWSRYKFKYTIEFLCTTTTSDCAGKHIGDVYNTIKRSYGGNNLSWPPPVSLSFDVTKELTAYAGYTDIYQSQADSLTADHSPLGPITGSNWEAGLKWATRDGKLNLSLAAYRIKQKGFAAIDQRYPYGEVMPGTFCCFLADPNQVLKSDGADVEATGEILPGWQVAASYTYNENKQKGSYFGGGEGAPFVSIQPKHLYKLWTSYDFGAAGRSGALSGLTLSVGVNGQSSGYHAGTVCPTNFYAPYPQYPGYIICQNPEVPFAFAVPPHAVLSGRIDYRFSDTWSLAVNLENILDKKYYQTVGIDPTGGNWYGAPRSFTATVRAKW